MIVLYIFFVTSIIFNSYSAVIEASLANTFNQERYDQFAKTCKFPMPINIFEISKTSPFIAQSNSDCLRQLITKINEYKTNIDFCKNKYPCPNNISRWDLVEVEIKTTINPIIRDISTQMIKARSLFNVFNAIRPDIFDQINSADACKNLLRSTNIQLLEEIKRRCIDLLNTIAWIENCRQQNTQQIEIREPKPLNDSSQALEINEITNENNNSDDDLLKQTLIKFDKEWEEEKKLDTLLNDTFNQLLLPKDTQNLGIVPFNRASTQREISDNQQSKEENLHPQKRNPWSRKQCISLIHKVFLIVSISLFLIQLKKFFIDETNFQ